jgi:dolichol-phosphate mannosyltransferase
MDVVLHGDSVSSLSKYGVPNRYEASTLCVCQGCSVYPQPSQIIADCLVVIPTFNERENIAAMIHALKSLPEPPDILVVDDNSPDGTARIVMGLIETIDGLYLLRRPHKTGLGGAYKAGFAFAVQHGWSYIVQMDADFSHDPQDVPKLIKACKDGADAAIGSRYIQGGRIKGWPWKRWLLSRGANLLAQVLLRCHIQDMTAGFKCFNRKALQSVNLNQVSSEGYIFQVEMNYRLKKECLNICQIPICFTDRQKGVSKMNFREPLEAIKQLVWMKIK